MVWLSFQHYHLLTVVLKWFKVRSKIAPFLLQSAALKEFDFLLDVREVSRPGPLVIPSAPTTPVLPPEQLVPPSPQPVVEFPEDEVLFVVFPQYNILLYKLFIQFRLHVHT